MTPAVRALESAGVPFTLHEYEHDPAARSFGLEAAVALGLDPDQVFKTLLVTADGEQAVGIVPVSCSLSLKAMGAALGRKRVEMCDPAVAQRVTGYVRGGISPFGQKKRVPTAIEATTLALPYVFMNGGQRGLQVKMAPADAVRAMDAKIAPLVAD